MNANEMLDYVFRQLDGPALEAAEGELAHDAALAARTERLSRAVRQLLDDGDLSASPAGLADRAMRFVMEAKAPRRKRTILDFAPVRVPFRWADVAVAAGIFVAGVLTLLPAVHRSREMGMQAGCSNNLMQLGRALWLYGNQHKHFPFAPEIHAKAPAGSFVAQLHDGGHLPDSDLKSIICPSFIGSAKEDHAAIPNFEAICNLCQSNPDEAGKAIRTSYAYNVGYMHPELKRVVPIAADHMAVRPLLADQPPLLEGRTLLAGNSPNHRGRGQNVLYSDLHVGWHNTRRLSPRDEDMYLNARHDRAPGVDAEDAVFLPSMAPALGW